MLINLAFEDGFDGDTVVVRVDGAEAYRAEGLTTRTQISRAGETAVDVPAAGATLEVEVPTRGVGERIPVDPFVQPNVALSLLDGRLVAAYPEHLGLA